MRSLRQQLALLFSLSSTAILVVLFAVGYQLLQHHLRNELDRLIVGHFEEIKSRLGPDLLALDSATLDELLRETTDFSSALFFVEVEAPGTQVMFRSHNLGNRKMPDVKGMRLFETTLPGVGDIRVREFLLSNFDVAIAMELAPLQRTMRSYIQACLALLVCMFVTSVGVGLVLGHIVLQPVRSISRTAHRIGQDNLGERIVMARVHDEMNELARLLNQMFDRIEAAFHQVRRFADDASHELKTPLTLIRLHAEKLLRGGGLTAAQEDAVIEQLSEVGRLTRIIDDLLFLSRAKAGAVPLQQTPQDPALLLASFEQDAAILAEHHDCRFELHHQGDGTVMIAAKWVRQILLNLLTNALNVSPPGGVIRVSSTVEAGSWRLSMEDEGPGLTAEQREQMFDRFIRFPNGNAGGSGGSGLGLAICRGITDLLGGEIYAEAGAAGGLRMVVELLVAEPAE